MTGRKKIILALRGSSFIIGAVILAWFGSIWVRILTLYGPGVNLWYLTHYSDVNFGYALLAHFAFFVLVGVALYPGRTPLSFGLILTGASCIALGQALMVNLGAVFFFAMDGPLGIAITLTGFVTLIIAAIVESEVGKATVNRSTN